MLVHLSLPVYCLDGGNWYLLMLWLFISEGLFSNTLKVLHTRAYFYKSNTTPCFFLWLVSLVQNNRGWDRTVFPILCVFLKSHVVNQYFNLDRCKKAFIISFIKVICGISLYRQSVSWTVFTIFAQSLVLISFTCGLLDLAGEWELSFCWFIFAAARGCSSETS